MAITMFRVLVVGTVQRGPENRDQIARRGTPGQYNFVRLLLDGRMYVGSAASVEPSDLLGDTVIDSLERSRDYSDVTDLEMQLSYDERVEDLYVSVRALGAGARIALWGDLRLDREPVQGSNFMRRVWRVYPTDVRVLGEAAPKKRAA